MYRDSSFCSSSSSSIFDILFSKLFFIFPNSLILFYDLRPKTPFLKIFFRKLNRCSHSYRLGNIFSTIEIKMKIYWRKSGEHSQKFFWTSASTLKRKLEKLWESTYLNPCWSISAKELKYFLDNSEFFMLNYLNSLLALSSKEVPFKSMAKFIRIHNVNKFALFPLLSILSVILSKASQWSEHTFQSEIT